jgi:8-amino-7-oxononanoate synthase
MENLLYTIIKKDIRVKESEIADRIGRNPFFSVVETAACPIIKIEGVERSNFGSNNYLDLTMNEFVKRKAIEAIQKYGTGFTGSRLLNGTSKLHKSLEADFAKFYNKESALVFSTGYTTNLGLLSGLLTRHHTVFIDEEIHASILDGLVLSRCKVKKFKHNNPGDLQQLIDKNKDGAVMCIIEGVYSMNGDIAPVDKFVDVCKKNEILLFVDEAHGFGVLGERGCGASEFYGVLDKVDIISVTFSKSLGSCGGALIGRNILLESIRFNSRPFLFTASNTPASIASAKASLDLLSNNPKFIIELNKKSEHFRKKIIEVGIKCSKDPTPIISIEIGDDFRVLQAWKVLWNRGVYCNPVVSPAVPKGRGILRFSIMRSHSFEEIERVVSLCDRYVKPLIKVS